MHHIVLASPSAAEARLSLSPGGCRGSVVSSHLAALHSPLSPWLVISAWVQLRSAGLGHSMPWLVLVSLDPVPGMELLLLQSIILPQLLKPGHFAPASMNSEWLVFLMSCSLHKFIPLQLSALGHHSSVSPLSLLGSTRRPLWKSLFTLRFPNNDFKSVCKLEMA